jgi:hypothetical protein
MLKENVSTGPVMIVLRGAAVVTTERGDGAQRPHELSAKVAGEMDQFLTAARPASPSVTAPTKDTYSAHDPNLRAHTHTHTGARAQGTVGPGLAQRAASAADALLGPRHHSHG